MVSPGCVAELTEVVGGSELEEEDEEVVLVVEGASEEDVWDWDVRVGDDEVRGRGDSELGSEEEVAGAEEEKAEEEKEDVLSLLRGGLELVEVLTLSLEEVGADVLLAWLLEPPPAVPEGDLSKAMYP